MNRWKHPLFRIGTMISGLLLLVPLFFTTGCGSNPAEVFVPLSSSMDAFRFTPGDYWVYERDGDLTLDSVYVTDVEEGTFTFESNPNVMDTWEFYRMDYFSSFRNGSHFECLNQAALRRDAGDVAATREGGKLLYTSSDNGWWSFRGTGTWQTRLVEQHNSLNIGGTLYNNVFELEIMSANTWTPAERYFVVEGVGIVRYETGLENPSNQNNWNLLRWQVSS